jgi:hypothetical protein
VGEASYEFSDPSHAFSTNGSYHISSFTKNGDISTNVLLQPIVSDLRVSSITSNASVVAHIPAAFEGGFVVITSNEGEPLVEAPEDTEDPSGDGKKRNLRTQVILRENTKIIDGSARWVEEKEESGQLMSVQDEEQEQTEHELVLRDIDLRGPEEGIPEDAENVEHSAVRLSEHGGCHGRKILHGSSISLVTSEGDASLFLA